MSKFCNISSILSSCSSIVWNCTLDLRFFSRLDHLLSVLDRTMTRCLYESYISCTSNFGSIPLFIVYLVSMFSPWPMKNARILYTIFLFDSAMDNCVSKYTRRTYDINANRYLNVYWILFLICIIYTNGYVRFCPGFVLYL